MSLGGIAGDALKILGNQQVLESCVSLWMQYLGNPTSITAGFPEFGFHLLCVTLSKSFLWECFLSKFMLSRKYQG